MSKPTTIGELELQDGELDGTELIEIEKAGVSKALTISSILELIDVSGLTPEQLNLLNSVKSKVDKIPNMSLSSNNFTNLLRAKLVDIEPMSTKNSKDAFLLSRTNHVGFQSIETITGLVSLLNSIDRAIDTKVTGAGVTKIVRLTQLEYDGLFENKDPNALYVIVPYTHGN